MPAKKLKNETGIEPQNAERGTLNTKPETLNAKPETQNAGPVPSGWFPKIDAAFTRYSLFVKQSWQGLFTDGLKIAGLEYAVILAFMVIAIVLMGGGAILGLGGSSGSGGTSETITQLMTGLGVAILILIPLGVIALLIAVAVSFLRYPAVDERAKGGKIAIFQKLKEIALPAIGYGLIIMIATLALLSPIILGLITKNLGAMCIFVILSFLAVLIFVLVTQFGQWELTIEKAGIFESLGRSYRLVKENIVEVIVFDILTIVLIILLYIPFWVASIVVQQIGINIGLVGLVVIVLGSMAINLVWSAVLLTLIIPLQYSFWKVLKEKK